MNCTYVKSNGERCRAYAVSNSNFCFRHDPSKRIEAKQSSANGGKANKHISPPLQAHIRLKKPKDVTKLLERTINELREGNINPKIATSIGYLSSQLIKAMEISDLEQRIHALERKEELQNES